MEDIKITKDNYKELFECAGFEWDEEYNAFCLDKHCGGNFLFLVFENEEVTAWVSTSSSVLEVSLNPTNNSTAEIDRLFYPFIDKPLVWQKKWDFESVFERESKEAMLPHKAIEDNIKASLYEHKNPRVQAFSRLLFVMEELNKEYKQITGCFKSAPDLDGRISVVTHNVNTLNSLFCFPTRKAVDLFHRDNEADLKTFFNI